ncbi:MAG: putative toxin-antitoxin system toxin component, PIN family [Anaerolineales bacterium]|nr:putative toxin-antitoxin system toxin component, PIN family [Anaerolineales bacterium]MDW8325734.1 putative toxin-antitoxin system toxin component, PIN family [Anaerolineales bacterium]
MTDRWRAVFDTNVYVAFALSRNPNSPTRELIRRLENREYILLACEAIADEVVEKLLERNAPAESLIQLLTALEELAEWVATPPETIVPLLPDPDDDVLLACAVQGRATHLVTYDPHFDLPGGQYAGVRILKPLDFLRLLRGASA